MKKTNIFLALSTMLVSSPVFAQEFGGNVTLGYNWQQLDEDGYASTDGAKGPRIEGSLGMLFGNFGGQIDVSREMLDDSDDGDSHSDHSWAALHLFYDFNDTKIGAFYGTGDSDQEFSGDSSDVNWYGVEIARDFSAFSLNAQLGKNENDSTHDPLDSDKVYATVVGSFDLGDRTDLAVGLSSGDGIVHGSSYRLMNFWIEGTYDIGATDLAAVARLDAYKYDGDGAPGGSLSETSIFLGVRYAFGNQSAVPMYSNDFPIRLSHASSQADN